MSTGLTHRFAGLRPAISNAVQSVFPLVAICVCVSTATQAQENVRLMGYLENAMIVEANIVMEAKLDTGADNSSIHAPDRELFEKGGEQWVRFTIEGSKRGRAELEKKVERIARIEQRVGVNVACPH